MFEARFDQPVLIGQNADLQLAFGTASVCLEDGAQVTLVGRIRLGSGVTFRGRCSLADGTSVDNGSILSDTQLGADNTVRAHSVLIGLEAGDRNLFGPFCFIRDDCTVQNDCILGAHVESARSHFASGVKISHRAFVGDAVVAENVIIGAGVVFCNWDGRERQPTHVGAAAIIGSGSLLVPPLTVGANAVIGAGSTITRDVEPATKVIQRRG